MLDSTAAFVLDCDTQIFVWQGKYCDFPAKRSAVMLAEEFIQMFERPLWTPITRVYESGLKLKNKYLL